MAAEKHEKHLLYNSLSILLKAVERQRTTVDLRNEASVFGIVEEADAFMNIVMRDCIFTDPRGDSFKYDMFFVQARNIRCVHIPPNIRIIPAIKEQLQQLKGPARELKDIKHNFRVERTQRKQREDLAAVNKILESRNKIDSESTERK
ncbi:PREDICTED: U7 snRNA-associated Sm-like protein LSm10 isoform X2 [Dinoponera quadriceps]|uniref:U7 snRNA-associated Sm-like protein LSm10 isoform X2 n=1 Tax=Dinoponera quadriceps TaxID=609295 RepID=A0A6P3XFZ9_DINQU|nr:PREDICTED: U7 snRNA-associated Sm-like protein LSm10 isoform X2 [Dinoponera quadriceps]